MFDILIRGARIIDGTGNPWFHGDLAVKDGRISAIGRLPGAEAVRVIEAGQRYLAPGFIDIHQDIKRVKAIREEVGYKIKIRLDANQGWSPKEAVRGIRIMEEEGLNIELVEQPVKAWDIEGLKLVTDNVETPIMADESMFSPNDAFKILSIRAADLINIKLMKCGGIHNALKIVAIAEACGVECMLGCMVESKLSVTAAAHLAGAKKNITRIDLDTTFLLAENPISGGIREEGSTLILPEGPGLGVEGIKNLHEIS